MSHVFWQMICAAIVGEIATFDSNALAKHAVHAVTRRPYLSEVALDKPSRCYQDCLQHSVKVRASMKW